jgi:hypothetical protein
VKRPITFLAAICWLSVTAMAPSTRAQVPVPVGFLPGLSEPGVWSSSGAALASAYNISPFYPSLTSGNSFQSQSSSLGTVSASTILVGHSAGGIVARIRGQSQPLAGIITLGTPNLGAPIEETFPVFCDYLGATTFDGIMLGLSLNPTTDQWILDDIEPNFDWAVGLLGFACDDIVEATGILGSTTNQAQLPPDAPFMNDTLNASANVSTEVSNVSNEASVVVVTDNFIDAGPFKAMSPDGAGEAWGHLIQGLASTMESVGVFIQVWDDPDCINQHECDVAQQLLNFGEDMLYIDDAWCQSVEGQLFECDGNDEIVPTWSQDLRRGSFVPIPDGPVHTREAQQGATLLPEAFDDLGIPHR